MLYCLDNFYKTREIDKINITELCKESGINRTTFYRHYELPQDILVEMQSEFFDEMIASFNGPMTAQDVEYFFDYLYQHADLVKLFMKYNSAMDLVRIFNCNFQSILEKRTLKDSDTDANRLLHTFLAGGSYFLLRQWLMEDIPKTPKKIADIALGIINKECVFQ